MASSIKSYKKKTSRKLGKKTGKKSSKKLTAKKGKKYTKSSKRNVKRNVKKSSKKSSKKNKGKRIAPLTARKATHKKAKYINMPVYVKATPSKRSAKKRKGVREKAGRVAGKLGKAEQLKLEINGMAFSNGDNKSGYNMSIKINTSDLVKKYNKLLKKYKGNPTID